MDKRLKTLFDYQRFKGDPKLEKIIDDTESRYSEELSDDEISIVSAAGDRFARQAKETDDNDVNLI